MFRWNEGVDDADIAAVERALGGLPAVIPAIRDYRFGRDAGVNDGNYDFVVVADFDDVDGYLVYRDHPRHREVIRAEIADRLAARAAVQYPLGDGSTR
jgi:hypothetical protein